MKNVCTDKAVNDNMVATEDAIRTNCIWYLTGKRSNATHSPGRGMPGGDLWAFDTMSRRAYPASADTKAGK
jgi:hypothetical protein